MLPELQQRTKNQLADIQFSAPKFQQCENRAFISRTKVKTMPTKVKTQGNSINMKMRYEQEARLQCSISNLGHLQIYTKSEKIKKTQSLSAEIQQIQKKIRACQNKMEHTKKTNSIPSLNNKLVKAPQNNNNADRHNYIHDFNTTIERELRFQTYDHRRSRQNFDHLTNPKMLGKGGEEGHEDFEGERNLKQVRCYSIEAGLDEMGKFYDNSLKKKFARRQKFPHEPCKRKTPKLYITQKTNSVKKEGKPISKTEHLFRVLTKEKTPQQIYPTIPNFPLIKDSLSKNIEAYLGDYRPFLEEMKAELGLIKQNEGDGRGDGKEDGRKLG